MKTSKIVFLVMGFLLLAIVTSASTYYFIYTSNPSSNGDIGVTVFINYGTLKEDNQEEYNLTLTEGRSALSAFSQVADLELINYTFGVYVVGVNGYKEQFPDYWSFYYHDSSSELWVYSEIGVDNYYLEDGNKIKLEYTG
ncbi:MAG: hypothetical protein KAS52_00625 [Candidatus Heimdallarchaeota archaeon]|nr:hypothetical protein [Candidatus Heimdallarchaeota archaeon]